MSVRLLILNSSKTRVPRAFLERWARDCERALAHRLPAKLRRRMTGELTLVFLGRREARAINKQYRGRDYATDVLSFEAVEDASLGELVLCPEVLKRQAAEHGLSYRLELGYMVLHGMLHLLGFDHERGEREARRMFEIQDGIFETLAAAPPRKRPARWPAR